MALGVQAHNECDDRMLLRRHPWTLPLWSIAPRESLPSLRGEELAHTLNPGRTRPLSSSSSTCSPAPCLRTLPPLALDLECAPCQSLLSVLGRQPS